MTTKTSSHSSSHSSSHHDPEILIASSTILRSTFWNLTGQLLPFLSALIVIPSMITHLGKDRFGLLTIFWMINGYFSLFDFGVGRALTQMIADYIGKKEQTNLSHLVSTANWLMASAGVVAAFLIIAGKYYLVRNFLNIEPEMQDECLRALDWLALSMPFLILASGFRGALEARQLFHLLNWIKIPGGVLVYAIPAWVALRTGRLDDVVAAITIVRIAISAANYLICKKSFQNISIFSTPKKIFIKPLLSFGGWMTVSNTITPILGQIDRFFIGSALGLAAVAFYTTPYEMVSKVVIIPIAIVGVLFPVFSTSKHISQQRLNQIFLTGNYYIMLAVFCIFAGISFLSFYILKIWINQEMAEQSALTLQILSVGFFLNCITQSPFAFLQALGKPKITALIQFIQLPIYLLILKVCLAKWGIGGAALAWSIRSLMDAIILFYCAIYQLKNEARTHISYLIKLLICTLLLAMIPLSNQQDLYRKGSLFTVCAMVTLWLFYSMPNKNIFSKLFQRL